jgi:hypothetical protein
MQAACSDSGRRRVKKSVDSRTTPAKMGNSLRDNSRQTIFQAARDRNTAIEKQAQRKKQCCTTVAAIHTGQVTKIRTRVFKKIPGGKKKWRVCISSG